MAFTAGILTTLLLLVSSVKASIDNTPTASAVCSATGFSPTFGYAHEAGKTIGFEVHIGEVGVASGAPCNAELATVTSSATTITKAQLNSNSEIPYLDSSQAVNCNGVFQHSGGYVEYSTSIDIVVTETLNSLIKRQKRFPVTLKCKVLQDVDATTLDGNFQVPAVIGNPESDLTAIDETFDFPIDFKFYTDSGRISEQGGNFNAEQGSTLYLRLSENPANSLLKFTTEKCYSTPDSSPTHATKDIFFEDECATDETVQFTDKTSAAANFDISIKAFFFSSAPTAAIYIHCDIFICKQDDDSTGNCVQNTNADCSVRRRKRRDVGTGGVVESRTLTSKQHVVLSDSEIIVPQCPMNSVYNRESEKCSKDNVVQVNDVYLDLPWNEDFANTSSKAFKDFALEKEYQLYALVQLGEDADNILGVKVVGARQGSVIVNVQIVYKSTIDSSQAFDTFKNAIQDPAPTGRASRIIHILNIKREKVIELVEIAPRPASSEIDKTMLIVLVVVLAAVVFIAGLVALKIRQVRRAPAATTGAPSEVKSFENPTLETVS